MQQGNYQIQKQQQVQTLSPQQVLVVKMLELPAVELEERVRAEVLDNPALEEGQLDNERNEDDLNEGNGVESEMPEGANEDISLGDYRTEDDIPDYKLKQPHSSPETQAEEIPFSDAISFYEILKEQLGERDLTERERTLVEYLIGSLDDDGLLRKDLSAIVDELCFNYNLETSEKELEEALKILQDFDPVGIGARNLQECLLIQLNRKEDSPLKQIELNILTKCYEEFTKKHWDKIL